MEMVYYHTVTHWIHTTPQAITLIDLAPLFISIVDAWKLD
jgi:hypothetical protein